MPEASGAAPDVIRFGVFELNLRSGELRKAGTRINLQGQPLQTLEFLLEHPGELVTREELRQRLWPKDTFVDFEHGLNAVINRLRDTLGDSADTPRFVETVPRRGYRFIAPVVRGATDREVKAARLRPASRHGKYSMWAAVVLAITLGAAASVYVVPLWLSSRAVMQTVPLTSLPNRERQPSFSPDGQQIAFVWDGEQGDNEDIYVKIVGAEGSLRLTSSPAADRHPVWSPDGRHIVFVRSSEEGSGIFIISALGGTERKIVPLHTAPYEGALGPSWSPNGQLLAITDRAESQGPASLLVVTIENLETRKLTSPPANAFGDFAPAFSPDGRSVAFIRLGSKRGIHIVPVDGGEPRLLTPEGLLWAERLTWTPDGRDLVFSSGSGARGSSSNLWKLSASGGTPERLAVGGDNAANPTISSRGNRLAYEQLMQDANIWQIEVPTSTPTVRVPARLIASTRHEAGPQFSPDGTRIVFHSDRTGHFEIWVCDFAGSNLVQLTSFGGSVSMVGTPRWSPDGRRIAFDVFVKEQGDIYVADVDGGTPQRVTAERSDEWVPSWSKDGRWIYFASDRTGRMEVWKVPVAGGSAVQVTRQGGFSPFESNDGKFLYYAKGLDADGLWSVAVQGGEEAPVMAFPRAGFWGYWALADTGIYFVNTDARPQPVLQFLSFAAHRVVDVAELAARPIAFEPGLAVSPDGSRILYTQEDQHTSDIMVVENFR